MAIEPGEAIEASDFVDTPAGAGDSGKVPKLDAEGRLDPDFLPEESPYSAGDKEFYVPIQMYTGNVFPFDNARGYKPVQDFNGINQDVYFSFRVPDDFGTLVSALLYITNQSGGTIGGDFTANWGANNESVSAGTGSASNVTDSVAFNTIGQLNFASALSGIAAGDLVGVEFNTDSDSLAAFGAWIKYTPA